MSIIKKFITLLISADSNSYILANLYYTLLSNMQVIKAFSILLRSYLIELGGLRLYSFEAEFIIQVINYLVSLYLLVIPVKLLLKIRIEYIQLEVRLISPF